MTFVRIIWVRIILHRLKCKRESLAHVNSKGQWVSDTAESKCSKESFRMISLCDLDRLSSSVASFSNWPSPKGSRQATRLTFSLNNYGRKSTVSFLLSLQKSRPDPHWSSWGSHAELWANHSGGGEAIHWLANVKTLCLQGAEVECLEGWENRQGSVARGRTDFKEEEVMSAVRSSRMRLTHIPRWDCWGHDERWIGRMTSENGWVEARTYPK